MHVKAEKGQQRAHGGGGDDQHVLHEGRVLDLWHQQAHSEKGGKGDEHDAPCEAVHAVNEVYGVGEADDPKKGDWVG